MSILPSLLHVWKRFFAQKECSFDIRFEYLRHTNWSAFEATPPQKGNNQIQQYYSSLLIIRIVKTMCSITKVSCVVTDGRTDRQNLTTKTTLAASHGKNAYF